MRKKKITTRFKNLNRFSDILAALRYLNKKDFDLTARFIDDLFTRKELWDLDMRLYCAILLNSHKSYSAIQSQTGISSATITKVSKILRDHDGGLKEVIEKLYPDRYSFVKYGLD